MVAVAPAAQKGHRLQGERRELEGSRDLGREGTTFVDSIENYLSKGIQLSPAEPETFQSGWCDRSCARVDESDAAAQAITLHGRDAKT